MLTSTGALLRRLRHREYLRGQVLAQKSPAPYQLWRNHSLLPLASKRSTLLGSLDFGTLMLQTVLQRSKQSPGPILIAAEWLIILIVRKRIHDLWVEIASKQDILPTPEFQLMAGFRLVGKSWNTQILKSLCNASSSCTCFELHLQQLFTYLLSGIPADNCMGVAGTVWPGLQHRLGLGTQKYQYAEGDKTFLKRLDLSGPATTISPPQKRHSHCDACENTRATTSCQASAPDTE